VLGSSANRTLCNRRPRRHGNEIPSLARRIAVAKIGITIVRGAEHVAVFNPPVNDCDFLESINGKESFLQGTILVGREAIFRNTYSTRIDRLLRTGPKGISGE